MQIDTAKLIAIEAVTYIFSNDELRDRFISLSGLSPSDIKAEIENDDFLQNVLDFFVQFEPDLLDFADHQKTAPEDIIKAWRALGGGTGQEW
jgi:hypothetical protein